MQPTLRGTACRVHIPRHVTISKYSCRVVVFRFECFRLLTRVFLRHHSPISITWYRPGGGDMSLVIAALDVALNEGHRPQRYQLLDLMLLGNRCTCASYKAVSPTCFSSLLKTVLFCRAYATLPEPLSDSLDCQKTAWFQGLSDHLMFLFCSTAGFVCMVCWTEPALSRFLNAL